MTPVRQGLLPRTVNTVVVYDFETGKLQHMHQHITLEGGMEPDHQQLEIRALENAAMRHGRNASRLKALHVAEGAIQPGKIYRVDVNRLALVELGSRPLPGQRTNGR